MSAYSYVREVAQTKFGRASPELYECSLQQLQSLRVHLLSDPYFGPFYKNEAAAGGPFADEMRWLEKRITDAGGSLK